MAASSKRRRPGTLDHEPQAVTWARKKAGLTQRSLARRIGISEQLLSEIESGWRNATPTNLAKIAEALNCPVVTLERGLGGMEPGLDWHRTGRESRMDEVSEVFEPGRNPNGGGKPEEPNGAMVLYPVAESVARARRWFRSLVEPHKPACSMDDCVGVISELVTNAVLYGEAEEEWRIRVEWWREGSALHVAVHNPGAASTVRKRVLADDSEHGRGLWLVDALADSWQVRPSNFGGTVVTFVMAEAWPA